MAEKIPGSGPDYRRIYLDILQKKYPHKMEECKFLLSKRKLLATDVIELNQKIFGNTANEKHRSYKRTDILQILEYQKKHKLNNTQLARQFNLSRNSVRKWKKIFLI